MNSRLVHKWLPTRNEADNKTKGGKALICAGSPKMPGAGILATKAALRTGVGYVYVSEPKVTQVVPESIPWKSQKIDHFQAILVGPGWGFSKSNFIRLKEMAKYPIPVVIDADALTLAANHDFLPFPSHWIATPHEGELSKLLKIPSERIKKRRLHYARMAQKKLGCRVLLKGHHSIVAFPNISVLIPTGNVALAKGGSGDVLAGIIVGFLSQQVSPDKAVLMAAYIHGWIADQWVKDQDYLSLTPSDLIERLPHALAQFRLNPTATL